MMHWEEETILSESSESDLDIDALLASLGGDEDLRRSVRSASVILVPTDLSPEYDGPAFPESSRDFYKLLKSKLAGDVEVEAAVEDREYREFEYRSEDIIIPTLYLAKHTLLPLAIGLIASFIYDKIGNRRSSNSRDRVKSEIHFKSESGDLIRYQYDGPASTFEQVSMEHIRDLGLWIEKSKASDVDVQASNDSS